MLIAYLVRPYWNWAQIMFAVAALAALVAVLASVFPTKVPLAWLGGVAVFFIAVGLFLAF